MTAAMAPPAMAETMARISSIQSRFGVRPPMATATATASPSAASTPSLSFDELLSGYRTSAASPFAAGMAGPFGAGTVTGTGGDAIVQDAMRYLGIPYLWGGTDPTVGLDCSGFVQNVFRDNGIELPRVSRDQARVGTEVPSLADARPGDLLFFHEPVSHVAIYLGDDQMIHAAGTGKDVRITDVYATPSHIRRVGPAAGAGGGAPAAATTAGQGVGAFASLFAGAGARYGIDPALLRAVAQVESGGNPNAVSPAGAEGLMQLMPATARGLGVTNSFDPAQAVDGAARYLRRQLDTFGSVELALAAYNAGPGAVQRHGGIPPYAETQAYVSRVMDAFRSAR